MPKLSDTDMEIVRARFAKSALGQFGETVNERDADVIAAPNRFRLHRRVKHQILRLEVDTLAELRSALLVLPPSDRKRVLVYAVKDYDGGARSALIPFSILQRLLL